MQKSNINPLALSQTISLDSKSHINLWIFSDFVAKILDSFTFPIKAYTGLDYQNVLQETFGSWSVSLQIEILWALTMMWTKTRRWPLYLVNLFFLGKTISSMEKKMFKPTHYRYYENGGIVLMAFSRNTAMKKIKYCNVWLAILSCFICKFHQCNRDMHCFEWQPCKR